MAPNRRIIRRESENQTCSRRDIENEPPGHPEDHHGPPVPARSSNITPSKIGSSGESHFRIWPERDEETDELRKVFTTLSAFRSERVRKEPHRDRVTLPLAAAQFRRLEQYFSDDVSASEALGQWYSRRVRYDYEASRARYTLRMPTAVHECFTASVVNAVEHAIYELVERLLSRKGKGRLATAHALKRIFKGGSTTIELHDAASDPFCVEPDTHCGQSIGDMDTPIIHRSPDASFYHHDAAELPQLVVEVGYSQHRDRLDRIAESYIVDSRHAIRCVMGFDIPYVARPGSPGSRPQVKGDRTATVSVWKPALANGGEGVSRCSDDSIPFRRSDGSACDGHITLFLNDVLPPATLDILPKNSSVLDSIEIPLAVFARALDAAERCQATISARTVRTSPPTTPTKFLKRKRTPSPELCDEREQFYALQERAELKRNQRADRAWRSPSGSRVVWHDVKRRRSPRNKVKVKDESEPD